MLTFNAAVSWEADFEGNCCELSGSACRSASGNGRLLAMSSSRKRGSIQVFNGCREFRITGLIAIGSSRLYDGRGGGLTL